MIVVKKDNGLITECEYPNFDISSPIDGLVDSIKFYFIEQIATPNYDARTHELQPVQKLIEKSNATYPHLGTAKHSWSKVRLSNETIISNLDNEVGNYLDTKYPPWKRQKHSDEVQFGNPSAERITKIKELKSWEGRVREQRDLQESQLINNGILPTFEFEQKPI